MNKNMDKKRMPMDKIIASNLLQHLVKILSTFLYFLLICIRIFKLLIICVYILYRFIDLCFLCKCSQRSICFRRKTFSRHNFLSQQATTARLFVQAFFFLDF